ncbi:MAG: 6-pyruvoyl tetrahydropterin synthase [Alphaproteobacteria bacterium RIFOXYD12_FULL_60_8]|nr:MAG: 6-pyruvoyl tetrahydropterin synthase [Alphaproteobacteria bacterium RIFOXYD12_FULL_60_8]
MSFSLIFSRRFSMAHRLIESGAEACATPHGHNEVVSVTLIDFQKERLNGHDNMVASFETAKRTWHRWIDEHVDHAFQLSERDPLIAYFSTHEPQRLSRLLLTPGDPTTEVLAACFMSKVNAILASEFPSLRCAEVRIEETPTNTVVFNGDPARVLPPRPSPWWSRADMCLNDLTRERT